MTSDTQDLPKITIQDVLHHSDQLIGPDKQMRELRLQRIRLAVLKQSFIVKFGLGLLSQMPLENKLNSNVETKVQF